MRQEVGGILRGILNRPPRTTLYFLFRGAEPLDLTIQAGKSIPLVVQPRNNPAAHRRLLQAWWRDYAAPRRLLQQKPDFPPQVETYLVSTLARRLESVAAARKSRRSRAIGSSSGSWARWPGARASARPSSRTACSA